MAIRIANRNTGVLNQALESRRWRIIRVTARGSGALPVSSSVPSSWFPAFGFRAPRACQRARLSVDSACARRAPDDARRRVILHGTPDEVQAIAARHHLPVRQLGDGGAVCRKQLRTQSWRSERPRRSHSADTRVHLMLTVSNTSTGAPGSRRAPGAFSAWSASSGRHRPGHRRRRRRLRHLAAPALRTTWSRTSASSPANRSSTRSATARTSPASSPEAASASVTPLYKGGIAPGANLVNVRVLGADGSGLTSDVIAGIDWAIDNRAQIQHSRSSTCRSAIR